MSDDLTDPRKKCTAEESRRLRINPKLMKIIGDSVKREQAMRERANVTRLN